MFFFHMTEAIVVIFIWDHAHPSILKIQSQDLSIGCPAATTETKGLDMGYSPNYSR